MKHLLILIALIGLVAAMVVGVRHRTLGPKITSGEHPLAPEFSVRSLDGGTIDLKALHGKVVLINFWATWCEPCRDEIPRFVELQNRYGSKGLQIVGVSMDDDVAPVRRFSADYKLNYPVALGGAKLGELYGGVLGLPISFLLERDGTIYARHVGAVDPALLEKEISHLLVSGDAGR